jgi:hypothetical protein
MVMTTLRNILFGILPRATTFQVISITQWLTSKKCLAKKAMHFSRNSSLEINQSVKDYQNAPDNIFRGRPDNKTVIRINVSSYKDRNNAQ